MTLDRKKRARDRLYSSNYSRKESKQASAQYESFNSTHDNTWSLVMYLLEIKGLCSHNKRIVSGWSDFGGRLIIVTVVCLASNIDLKAIKLGSVHWSI